DAPIGLQRTTYANKELNVLLKPGRLQLDLELQPFTHKRNFLVIRLGKNRQQVVEVVPGNRWGSPGLLLEDRELSHQPAELLVSHQGMNSFHEREVRERGIAFVKLPELGEDQGIARSDAIQAQAARDRLPGQLLDLPPNPVIDRLKNTNLEIAPGVASQDGREVVGVELG